MANLGSTVAAGEAVTMDLYSLYCCAVRKDEMTELEGDAKMG